VFRRGAIGCGRRMSVASQWSVVGGGSCEAPTQKANTPMISNNRVVLKGMAASVAVSRSQLLKNSKKQHRDVDMPHIQRAPSSGVGVGGGVGGGGGASLTVSVATESRNRVGETQTKRK
jgi:hypothetical protein